MAFSAMRKPAEAGLWLKSELIALSLHLGNPMQFPAEAIQCHVLLPPSYLARVVRSKSGERHFEVFVSVDRNVFQTVQP